MLVLDLAACYVTAGVGYPAEFIDSRRPSRIWVTETNDSLLSMDNPHMQGDTLDRKSVV